MPMLVELDVPPHPVEVSLFGAPAVVPDAENLNDPVVQTRRRSIRKQAERSGTEFGGGRHEDTSANRGGTSPDDGILLCPDASCQSLGSVDLSQFENGDHFDESLAVSFASAIVGDTTH